MQSVKIAKMKYLMKNKRKEFKEQVNKNYNI